jgi:hypothetical protein
MIFAIPALLIRRLGFAGSGAADGSDSPRIFAHLFRCTSAILARPAPLIFRRLRSLGSIVAGGAGPPYSTARSSAILVSMRVFWNS